MLKTGIHIVRQVKRPGHTVIKLLESENELKCKKIIFMFSYKDLVYFKTSEKILLDTLQ